MQYLTISLIRVLDLCSFVTSLLSQFMDYRQSLYDYFIAAVWNINLLSADQLVAESQNNFILITVSPIITNSHAKRKLNFWHCSRFCSWRSQLPSFFFMDIRSCSSCRTSKNSEIMLFKGEAAGGCTWIQWMPLSKRIQRYGHMYLQWEVCI